MRILVTGGSGFLGKAVVRELLRSGHGVRVFARNPEAGWNSADSVMNGDNATSENDRSEAGSVEFFRGDIADAEAVRRACAGMDAVVHTAAKAGVWGAAAEFRRVNVGGTRNVVEGCRAAKVPFLVHTSTPSVVYSGGALAGADERLPLTRACPSEYPLTKAEAERLALAADGASLRVVALRPHLIWGAGDPHLVPRVVRRARAGRLKIVGDGANRVDLTHVGNAALAHRLALEALAAGGGRAAAGAGRAYFISDGAPVRLWDWINALLERLGVAPVGRRVPLGVARFAGGVCEALWRCLPLAGEPPMTRFVADELAHDHWFDISAARRDLGYTPVAGGAADMDALVEWLTRDAASSRGSRAAG